MDPGKAFITELIAGQHEEAGTDQNGDDGDNDPLDDDASQFLTTSLDSLAETDIFGNFESCPSADRAVTGNIGATENSPNFADLPILLDRNDAAPQIPNNDATNEPTTSPIPITLPNENGDDIPKGRSLAHHHLRAGKLVFVSFDLETGGEFCGILQLSAEISRIELLPKTNAKGIVSSTGDTASNIRRKVETFNSFVNPGEGASTEIMQLQYMDYMHLIQASGMLARSMLCGKGFVNGSV